MVTGDLPPGNGVIAAKAQLPSSECDDVTTMDSGSLRVATWIDQLVVGSTRSADSAAGTGDLVPAAFIEDLRSYLDSRAEEATADLDPKLLPLRLPKSRLATLERCERMALAQATGSAEPEPLTDAMFRGSALDRFVVHQLTVGRVLDPVETLRAMLAVEEETELLNHLEVMGEVDEGKPASMLDPLASAVADGWSGIDPAWFPRTQSRAAAVFGDGGVVSSGRLDVELGGAVAELPGVVVEVKSGRPQREHVAEMYFYALLVALRDGQAPVAMLSWYPGAAPGIAPISAELLESVAVRLADSMFTWAALVDGPAAGRDASASEPAVKALSAPRETPGVWCQWCPDSEVCPSSSTRPE